VRFIEITRHFGEIVLLVDNLEWLALKGKTNQINNFNNDKNAMIYASIELQKEREL
jgi:hypothetical protein